MSRYVLLALHVVGAVPFAGLSACQEPVNDLADAGPDGAPSANPMCTPATLTCPLALSTTSFERCQSGTRCELRRGARTYPCPGDCTTCAAAESALREDACAAPTCAGTPTACSLRPKTGCDKGDGCRVASQCLGTTAICTGRSKYDCGTQRGCSWTGSACTGSAWGCSLFASSASCGGQNGCRWESVCDGVAMSCSAHGTSTCSLSPGCAVATP